MIKGHHVLTGTVHHTCIVPYLKHNSWFLQQICPHVRPDDVIPPIKANLNVLPESTAVIIPGGLSITYGLDMRRKYTSVWAEELDRPVDSFILIVCWGWTGLKEHWIKHMGRKSSVSLLRKLMRNFLTAQNLVRIWQLGLWKKTFWNPTKHYNKTKLFTGQSQFMSSDVLSMTLFVVGQPLFASTMEDGMDSSLADIKTVKQQKKLLKHK